VKRQQFFAANGRDNRQVKEPDDEPASKFVPDSTPLDMATASTEGAGVDADRFRGLSTAAKYAWRWRAFN
jgi:hypothetical protein